jgi:hypothetical protein
MNTTISPKSLHSVLILAGVSSARQSSSMELAKSFAQLLRVCDVVPIISTLNDLLPKLNLPAKKASLANLRDTVAKQCTGKTQFKIKGAALALVTCSVMVLSEELTPDEAAASFPDFMTVEIDFLKAANPKKAKTATSSATDTATTSTTDTATTEDKTVSVDTLFHTAIHAINGGLFSDEQLSEIRLALATMPTITSTQLELSH